jgi:hypothetical protein
MAKAASGARDATRTTAIILALAAAADAGFPSALPSRSPLARIRRSISIFVAAAASADTRPAATSPALGELVGEW